MSSKPKMTQPETPTEIQERDSFFTPIYGVDILIPFIPKKISRIWECANGKGNISNYLEKLGYDVYRSDIDGRSNYCNFLLDNSPIELTDDLLILTNPPFSLKSNFYDKCMEYGTCFALLVPADYSIWVCNAIRNGIEKIIPTRRIDYITPNIVENIFKGELKSLIEKSEKIKFKKFKDIPLSLIEKYSHLIAKYKSIDETPVELLSKYSKAQFHSLWMTQNFGIGKSEVVVNLTTEMKQNIL